MNCAFKYKKLIDKCKNISKNESIEVLKLIQQNNIKYTENNNGIHIVLNEMPTELIDKIIEMLDFIKFQNNELIQHEEYINNIKQQSLIIS